MVLDKLRLRKKKEKAPEIPRSEVLRMRPVRNPGVEWEKTGKGIRLIIPLREPKAKKEKGIMSKIVPQAPKEKRIDLDKVGALVWDLCDGKNTVDDIARRLNEKYKLMPTEAELSLNTYLQQLSKRKLIGFIVPEETRVRLEKEALKKGKKKKKKSEK